MLYKNCIAPDNGKRVRETGSISPASCLKNGRARLAFSWAASVAFSKRYFTEVAVRKALLKLIEMEGVRIPLGAGLPFELWLQQQTRSVLHLCQRARLAHPFDNLARWTGKKPFLWRQTWGEKIYIGQKPYDVTNLHCFFCGAFSQKKNFGVHKPFPYILIFISNPHYPRHRKTCLPLPMNFHRRPGAILASHHGGNFSKLECWRKHIV